MQRRPCMQRVELLPRSAIPSPRQQRRMIAMQRKPQVAVEPRPDGRWAVQTDGTQRAYRVKSSKAEAVKIARTVATHKGAEVVVKNEQGRIGAKDSHGHDPRNIP